MTAAPERIAPYKTEVYELADYPPNWLTHDECAGEYIAATALSRAPEVLELIRQAVEAERERCAKAAENEGVYPELNVWGGGPDWYKHGKRIAATIRAGGGE